MSEKSHVSLGQFQCQICGTVYDSGDILLDKKMRQVLDRHTITGYKECEDCVKHLADDMIALVEVLPPPAWRDRGGLKEAMKPNEANRTGRLAWLRRPAWKDIFGGECPTTSMCFVEEGVIAKLEAMVAPPTSNEGESGDVDQPE